MLVIVMLGPMPIHSICNRDNKSVIIVWFLHSPPVCTSLDEDEEKDPAVAWP